MMMTRRTLLGATLALPFVGTRSAAEDGPMKIRDLYGKLYESREAADALIGQRITLEGFMAPPLKAGAQFFVLTKMPMAVCPFCETESDWPSDILAVYTKRSLRVVPYDVKIEARGVLEIGSYRDPDTGFLSVVRLMDATYG